MESSKDKYHVEMRSYRIIGWAWMAFMRSWAVRIAPDPTVPFGWGMCCFRGVRGMIYAAPQAGRENR